MEHQKTLNLLNEGSDSRFVTKWNIGNDQSNPNYVGNEIIHGAEIFKSNRCDYNNALHSSKG